MFSIFAKRQPDVIDEVEAARIMQNTLILQARMAMMLRQLEMKPRRQFTDPSA